MDCRSYTINSANEFRLRRHIREVLLPYARVHLTTDHVAFTEAAVEELLLRNLEYVPMADVTSFRLPTEPFELLMRFLDALDLALPEEKWTTLPEDVRFIRDFFSRTSAVQDLPSERYWYAEDDLYKKLSAMCNPLLTPTLTRRSRLSTPKLGSLNYERSIPCTVPALNAFIDSKPVPTTPVEVGAPAVDDVLDLCLKIDSATSAQVRDYLRSVLSSTTRGKPDEDPSAATSNAAKFLNCVSPPLHRPGLESPPLFPRRHLTQPGANNHAESRVKEKVIPACVSDLAPILTTTRPEWIDSEDGDQNGHHMEVISGWTTITISSPPPPLANSSDQSEVDELWDESPPRTPQTSLITVKMDEVEIPRIRKFGHKSTLTDGRTTARGAADSLVGAESPGFFITSFISARVPITPAPKPVTSQAIVQSPRPLSPDQTILNSLLGQPPTAREEQVNEEAQAAGSDPPDYGEESELDAVVAGLCASIPHDPLSYVLEEKLDDKEIMLMDVPHLAPPTAHLKEIVYFPQGMRTFVSPKGESEKLDPATVGSHGVGPLAFLRPVKGIKPLSLDLSWRPFNFGKAIPTNEDVAGVARVFETEDEVLGYNEQKHEKAVRSFFNLLSSTASPEEPQAGTTLEVPRGCKAFGTSPTPKRHESGDIEYILTNRERKASGTKPMLEAEVDTVEDMEPDWATDLGLQDDEREDSRELRTRGERQTLRTSHTNRAYGNKSGDNQFFDDSGIDLADEIRGQLVTSEFGSPVLLLEPGDEDDLRRALNDLEANKENIDPRSENKENAYPWDDLNDQAVGLQRQSQSSRTQYDWTEYIEYPETATPPFEPLSFPSQSQVLRPSCELKQSMVQGTSEPPPSIGIVKRTADDLVSANKLEANSMAIKRRKLDDLVPTSSRDLFATFIGLRNQVSPPTVRSGTPVDEAPPTHQTVASAEIPPRAAPNDIFDRHTARLPEHWIPAAMVHRYLASMALIQKRALVHELQEEACGVLLVERYDLGGTDIVIDPDHGVLLVPLLALPANLEDVVERISCESWRYQNLFIVLEAYPSAQSFSADRSRETNLTPCAYTPPICKAIKKLRRNLGIAQGCGTMDPRCVTTWAFANDVGEAARFVRFFGEEARAKAVGNGNGIIWDEREWLEQDEREGESDLAGVHGMNTFAAFVMLYNHSLEDILDLPSEVRLADFGRLLGQDRMVELNAVIERRLQLLAADTAESVVGAGY